MACTLDCGYLVNGRICSRINPSPQRVAANGALVVGGSCLEGMTDAQMAAWNRTATQIMTDHLLGPLVAARPVTPAAPVRFSNTEGAPPPLSFADVIAEENAPLLEFEGEPTTLAEAIAEQRRIDNAMRQDR